MLMFIAMMPRSKGQLEADADEEPDVQHAADVPLLTREERSEACRPQNASRAVCVVFEYRQGLKLQQYQCHLLVSHHCRTNVTLKQAVVEASVKTSSQNIHPPCQNIQECACNRFFAQG